MYILKNALRCISRAKGRNILIGVIVLVIAVSCCLGLSIRQAAETAKTQALDALSVTATISYDRSKAMEDMQNSGTDPRSMDKSELKKMMANTDSLSLSDYKKYAKASTVKDFTYTLNAYANASGKLEPVSSDGSGSSSSSGTDTDANANTNAKSGNADNAGQGGMSGMGKPGFGGDFSLVGYSSENALTAFANGTCAISDGTLFDVSKDNGECVISQELAQYNNLSVGDTITLCNANDSSDKHKLKVVGIYTNSEANADSQAMHRSLSDDPANQILMSYSTLTKLAKSSAKNVDSSTQPIQGNLNATYSFASVADYETFSQEVYDLGLDSKYTVSSSDLTAFQNSIAPLETLSSLAGYFLLVILIIGAIILVVLNIFNVRERKYEIGVLTAMGMKKGKVALQFLTEIFAITLTAVLIGAGIGAVSSVPVTNSLLESQIQSQSAQTQQVDRNFGRGGQDNGNANGAPNGAAPSDQSGAQGAGGHGGAFGAGGQAVTSYVSQIDSAMDLQVLLELLGIGVLLTLVSGAASMLFIMRYDPLKILANRD